MPAGVRVLLLSNLTCAFGRGLLRGVRAYAREHGPWAVSFYNRWEDVPPSRVRDHDAVIAQVAAPVIVRPLERLGIPVVNVSNSLRELDFPRVSSDDVAVGRLGADYFLQGGFRNLGFCGFGAWESAWHGYAILRAQGFLARASEAGIAARCLDTEHPIPINAPTELATRMLGDWVRSLPRPAGVMAANDIRARHVIRAAQEAGLHVPEEIAVLGVDNDEVECEMAELPISSVAVDFAAIGYEAAVAVDRLLARKKVKDVLIPPRQVVVRQSSDILAIDDPPIASAVRFIREHAGRRIGVKDVADAVTLSRRTLERRFRAALGFAPHHEIRRCHVERAKELLAETSLSMGEVAAAAGFRDASTFSALFSEATGLRPTAYRKQYRTRTG